MIEAHNAAQHNLGLYNTTTHYIKKVSMQNNIAAKQNEEQLQDSEGYEIKRQTYGLAILELMSDQEYQAWMRATVGMTETEKILAVQKLYPLADIERLKSSKMKLDDEKKTLNDRANLNEPFIINANKLNGIKMFNTNTDFIQRYKNAFENLHINVDVNG